MKHTPAILIFLMLHAVAYGGEGLKTECYEAAVDSITDPTINFKRWTTSRDGKVILVREERDLSRDGSWSQINQTIMSGGKAVVSFALSLAKRSETYHPDAGIKVMRADSDGDGFCERIMLIGDNNKTVDILTVDKAGRITPVSDQELANWHKSIKELQEVINKFDRARTASKPEPIKPAQIQE